MPSAWWVTCFLLGDGFADKLWLCYKHWSLPSMFTVRWVSDEWWVGQAASWTVARPFFFFFVCSELTGRINRPKSVLKLHQQRRVSSDSPMYPLKNVYTDMWRQTWKWTCPLTSKSTFFSPLFSRRLVCMRSDVPVAMTTVTFLAGVPKRKASGFNSP